MSDSIRNSEHQQNIETIEREFAIGSLENTQPPFLSE